MAGFLFMKTVKIDGLIFFEFLDMDLIQEKELESGGYCGLEIGEEGWNRIMAKASKFKASIIEAHSHPFSKKGVSFSGYDLEGFKELVPQLWWRLGGVPYMALVFGRKDFDAIVWVDSPHVHRRLKHIVTDDGKILKPTNMTAVYLDKRNSQWKRRGTHDI
ncbi:MAG: hypothetical protein HY225_03830 [Candidatus Vogelbacteria bacterium]|nr:hypothetical protein [Candidatus Vogelbacteria bacterium]